MGLGQGRADVGLRTVISEQWSVIRICGGAAVGQIEDGEAATSKIVP